MTKFQLFTALTTLTAFTAFAAQVFFRLKGSLGMAVAGAAISLVAFIVGLIWPEVGQHTETLFSSISYPDAVFHGMLCFLIFAAAMHVNLRDIYRWKITVTVLATVGVLISTLVVAFMAYLFCKLDNLQIPFTWLLVFGALISPTDPVAVMALLKELNADKDLETKIAAESLLNDGTAIVLFSVFLAMATDATAPSAVGVAGMFMLKVLGGLGLGAVLGLIGHYLLKVVNDPPTSVVMTLAYALGGYTLGESLCVSGPLVAAAMGLVVGHGRHSSMDAATQAKLVPFWEMFDELLNMLLFMLVGMSLLALPESVPAILFGVAAIASALVGRFFSVSLPLTLISKTIKPIPVGTVQAMVWGGVRGGVSLAMVLSLPDSPYKPFLVSGTWAVVMFSLLVQAPTLGKVLRFYGLVNNKA